MFHLLLAIIYLAFISLGLPDGLLGSAWPSMYQEFQVPVSYAGIISMIIAAGTIISSLQSDRLTPAPGARKGDSYQCGHDSGRPVRLLLQPLLHPSVPVGHSLRPGCGQRGRRPQQLCSSPLLQHTHELAHCMWGVGASAGPYIMGLVLSGGAPWNTGYRYVGILQVILTAILLLSLPLWKNRQTGTDSEASRGHAPEDSGQTAPAKPLSLKQIAAIPGAKEVMVTFFCYCALEQTAGLWAASYLMLHEGISSETAAFYASLFYIGITVGRGASGFLTMRFNDTRMIRLGLILILAGVLTILLPLGGNTSLAGLIIVGLGCAPVYPCVIHSTPERFGADRSRHLSASRWLLPTWAPASCRLYSD